MERRRRRPEPQRRDDDDGRQVASESHDVTGWVVAEGGKARVEVSDDRMSTGGPVGSTLPVKIPNSAADAVDRK